MKLDKNQPYGEIWGHEGGARYEQAGVLFNANGEPLSAPKASAKPATESKAQVPSYVVSEKVQNAVEFLKNVLSGGKVKRNNIYRDAQNSGHVWDDVQKAASMLSIQKIMQRGDEFWKLTEQEHA